MARVCALDGCNADLDWLGKNPRARYCGGAHRAEASRRRLGPMVRARPKRRATRRPRPSDVRVPYARIVDVLTDELGASQARVLAEAMLTEAQRERLDRAVPRAGA